MTIAEQITRAKTDYDEVYGSGEKAEWNAFWDAYQDKGKREKYDSAFAGTGWNDETFKPKYDIIPNWNVVSMFYLCQITDLEAILNDCGVVLDISNNANYSETFARADFTVLPEITFSKNITGAYLTFNNDYNLHTIRKITFLEGIDASRNFNTAFTNCTALANIVFAGVLPCDINFQWCPLTRASIESLFGVLSDTVSGKTVTLNKAAKEAAFTDDEWAALIATKPNWTIELL